MDEVKAKSIPVKILSVIFSIYWLSVMVMSTYYWWSDVKSHDSFMRTFTISPAIGLFKATHWPYYTFFKKETHQVAYQLDSKTKQNIDGFFHGYEYAMSANTLTRAMMSAEDANAFMDDYKKAISLFSESQERLATCDRTILNGIYSGWGDMVLDKFIPAIDKIMEGSKPDGDRNELVRSEALMVEFDNWLQENWHGLLDTIDGYGYELLKYKKK